MGTNATPLTVTAPPTTVTSAKASPLLQAENVTKRFGEGGKSLLVLQDIDFAIHEGEIIAILGPSGSGKSTLLRVLAGLTDPSEGQCLFQNVPQKSVNKHIAIVFQSFALFPWLTVYQNVELGLLSSDVPEMQRRRRILEAIDVIGLDGFEDAFPKELSGGMRQRVGIARALVVYPEILFLDEAFSALDILTSENLRGEILSLWRSGKMKTKAIVMVTHSIEEAALMGDRIVVMGANPGIIRVDMPGLPATERGKDKPNHVRLVDYLYSIMMKPDEHIEAFHADAATVRAPRKTMRAFQSLPQVAVGQLRGLVGRLHSMGGRADVYVLGRELNMEVDELLPLVQAIDILDLGNLESGDVYLTATGERFAGENGLQQKEIFREQASMNVQLLQKITKEIDQASNGRVSYETMLHHLEEFFPPDTAESQLDTGIDWGRYAELFSYDDSEGVFYKEDDDA